MGAVLPLSNGHDDHRTRTFRPIMGKMAGFHHAEVFVPVRLLCFFLLLCTGSLQAQPAAAPEMSGAPKVVTSTVTPWGIDRPGQPPQGMLVDMQRALFQRAGLPFHNDMKPYPRVIADIESGQADVAVMFVSPESERTGISLGQVVQERIVVAMRAEAAAITQLNDLSNRYVGHVRGSRYGAAFDEHPGIIRVPVTDAEQGLRMLLAGRLDAMASTEHSLLYALYNAGLNAADIRIALPLLEARADLYISRRAADAPWREALQQALNAMQADNSLAAALYSHPYWPYTSFCFAGNRCLQAASVEE